MVDRKFELVLELAPTEKSRVELLHEGCNLMAGGDLDGDVYFVCWD